MIKIIKEEKKNKVIGDPYYLLKYRYMIGDSNGYTSEEATSSINNPYLERYVTLLNSLKPTKGHWGIVLEESRIYDCYKEGQITEDDYNFLMRAMFQGDEEEYPFKIILKYEEDFFELGEGVRSDTEYSFLVFEGLDLFYIDEYGKKHNTEIIKD